jgi:hypothetical protein
MIADNQAVPICAEHSLKVTRCVPCQLVLAAHWEVLVKREVLPWKRESESLADYHWREQKVNEENQNRLHAWAKVHVYVDDLAEVF